MTSPTILVVAKAPVPGLAKTRVAATVGGHVAAEVAAAALLDTLEVATSVGWRVVVAMVGDLAEAARREEILHALSGLEVIAQRGDGLGERLAAAHADADAGHGVVQIGMDTPHITADDLRQAGELLASRDAVVGPAVDGGWWLLAVRHAGLAQGLVDVPMSSDDTCAETVAALRRADARIGMLRELDDVDVWEDATDVAQHHPHLRMASVVHARSTGAHS